MTQFTAVTRQHFANKAWKRYTSYSFAGQANYLPVVADELASLVPTMPLGFVQRGETFGLVAITSLLPNTNLLVAPDGRWLAGYVPATLRAHPFRVGKPQGNEDSILCIDEDSGLIVEAGQGEPFFDDMGAPSQAMKDVLEFLARIERNQVTTQEAVNALQTAGVIQPMVLNVTNGDKTIAVEGLWRIDEATLNNLPDEIFLSLRKTGALALAHAQLFSLNQFSMLEKLDEAHAKLKRKIASPAPAMSQLGGFQLSKDDGTLKFS